MSEPALARTWRAGGPRTFARTDLPPRRLLMLYQHTVPGRLRTALRQKLHVLEHSLTPHEIVYWNAGYTVPKAIRELPVDAILLDTTLLEARWAPEFPARRATFDWLAERRVPKIAFPQDEYDHAHVLDDWLADLGVDVVFSIFDAAAHPALYPRCAGRVRFERCLTGYVDEAEVARTAGLVRPHRERPLDLAYRARRAPFRFGTSGQLKHRIGEAFAPAAAARGVRADLSTQPQDAILGDAWFPFLASARAVLGVESGAGAIDRRGELRTAEDEAVAQGLDFAAFDAAQPAGWDDLALHAIGPRHLEAATALTAQVLVAGSYEGLLDADRHYLPVRPDLSDVDAALDRLQDVAAIEAMAVRTYEDVVLSGRFAYAVLAAQLEQVLADLVPSAGPTGSLGRVRAAAAAYNLALVRPPRWAARGVERVAPNALDHVLAARARWYERLHR
jgi:hypothetical protein